MRRVALRRSPPKPSRRPTNMGHRSHDEVLARDGQCMAVLLDPDSGSCRDRWGVPTVSWRRESLTVDHIKAEPMMGQSEDRDDPWQAVCLCWNHHLNGWATAHRPLLRAYLRWRRALSTDAAARAAREEMSRGR